MTTQRDRRGLLRELRSFLPSIVCREVLAAREGLKVARTGLRPRAAERLARLGGANGFAVVVGRETFHPRRDRGKGGWCNGIREGGSGPGFRNVYIAARLDDARRGHDAEQCGDENAFGAVLAVPRCCREFYEHNQRRAESDQNDFFPLSAERISGRPHAAMNLGAQYFDASLLSHFPCGLYCAASLKLARACAELIAAYDRTWLDEMLTVMSRPTIYTEYEGVFLMRAERVRTVDDFDYAPDVTMGTARGRIARALSMGGTLRRAAGDRVEVLRNGIMVASLRAHNLRVYAPLAVSAEELVS